MDGSDLTMGLNRDGTTWRREQLTALTAGNVPATPGRPETRFAVPEPASPEEIDAIIAVVPRGCRGNAAWAVPLLLDTARTGGITHPRRIAYLLATAQHESRFGEHLVERAADGVVNYFDRFEPGTSLGAARGNSNSGDGERFRGRGFVHIRGRVHYTAWSHRLGMPAQIVGGEPVPFFVANPDAMARPHIAAQTLVRGMRDGIFTGAALGYYVNDKKTDYYNARRVIDGTSQARDIAAVATMYQAAIENAAAERHRTNMRELASRRANSATSRDLIGEVRDAVNRLALRGEILAYPTQVLDWNGEARQGKFVQLDEQTCALHMGRGVYVQLDVQRDLNGVMPAEGKNMALKRSGDVRPALRNGDGEFWR